MDTWRLVDNDSEFALVDGSDTPQAVVPYTYWNKAARRRTAQHILNCVNPEIKHGTEHQVCQHGGCVETRRL